MWDAETFLTVLYVEVDTVIKQQPVLHTAAARWAARVEALSLSEVATLALFGQFACFGSERGFYRYAEQRLRPLFPTLPDRTQFNRLQRRAHETLVALGQHWAHADEALARAAGEVGAGAFEAVDTLGVVVRNSKRRGHGWLVGQADRGWCTRVGWFEGLRLLTCVTPGGAISAVGVAAGSAKEQPMADTFFAARRHPAVRTRLPAVGQATGQSGYYLTDAGFEGAARHRDWWQLCAARVVTAPNRARPEAVATQPLRRWVAGWRQIVETVHAALLGVFRLDRERPHLLAGFQARLAAKVGLHNCCHWLNRCVGRPPLAFADLLDL